jgi:nitric oxide reductase subunit B
MVWKGGRDHPNKAALLWALGCSVMSFFGAGVWGFLHTLSFVNYYSHGTQITAAHGHFAFYGAYAMVNLAMITYAAPMLARREPYNQGLNILSFWVMNLGVVLMVVSLTFAGVLQTHLERVQGADYMSVQQQLGLFYYGRLWGGITTAAGLGLFLLSILWLPRRAPVPAAAASLSPAE